MATLSSSWEPAAAMSRAPSPLVDRAISPISRSTSPVLKAGNTATIIAFRNARDTYRKSLSEKDMKRIMVPTGPEDVVNDIEKWEQGHSESKLAAGVRVGLIHLQRFGASIDMLAQGTPSPGCLLWGSIKFVLTVSSMLILYVRHAVSNLCEHRYLRSNEQCSQALSRFLAFVDSIHRSQEITLNSTYFAYVLPSSSVDRPRRSAGLRTALQGSHPNDRLLASN